MITLTQVERLVRKIDELIGRPGLEAQAAKLAQDYAELARSANRRLEQCAAMIENGEDLQALQLAETQPPLLDLVTLLGFRQAKEWRDYCQSHNLPVAEPFYDKHIRILNTTYGKGLTSDQSFYRDYRRAVMMGDEARALSILRVLARLNPGDRNTAQELQRLEQKAVQKALEDLRQIMATNNDTQGIITKLTQLEASSLAIPANDPVWLQAQIVRCQDLLGQAQALREQDAVEQTADLVEEIRRLAEQNDIPLSAADTQAWTNLEAWVSDRRAASADEQDYQNALGALQYQLETFENTHPGAGRPTLPQMQADQNLLTGKVRDLERFGRPIEEDLAGRSQEIFALLDRQIKNQQKRRQLAGWAGVIAVLVVIVGAALWYLALTESRDITKRLQTLTAARRVTDTEQVLGEAESLIKHVPSFLPPALDPSSGLKQAMTEARQSVSRELEFKREFDLKLEMMRELAAHGFASTSDQIASARSDCAQALDNLAPEFKTDAESQLAGLQPANNSYFEKLLTSAENDATANLNLAKGFDALASTLPRLQGSLAGLEKQQNETLPVAPALISRYRDLTNQCSLWQMATDQLLGARTVEDYFNGLKQLAQSSLLPAVDGEALGKALELKASQSELLGALLLPGQPQAWAQLDPAADPSPKFRPDQPSDEEKSACLNLSNDKNAQEIYSYHLDKRLRHDNTLESHYVFTQGKLRNNKSGQPSGLVYDPTQFPDQAQFEQSSYDDWDYTNVSYIGMIKESRSFQDWQLGDLIDPNTGNYQKSILQLLDQISQDQEASAIFRAYISLRLFEIAELRPVEWGLSWCPGAAVHIQSLKDLGAGNLRSGDWLVGARYPVYEQALKQYFDRARANSLERQARFFKLLDRRACEAGFDYVGFADANGYPRFNQANSTGLECWGWSLRSYSPAVVLRRTEASQPWVKPDALLPFTPLFVFREDRRVLLKQASDTSGYPSPAVSSFLPPLFSGL